MHLLHMQLYIQLRYDHDHDGHRIIKIKINCNLQVYYFVKMRLIAYQLRIYSNGSFKVEIFQHVYQSSNTTGATSGGGTTYPSRAHEFTPGFQCDSYYSIFSFLCNILQIVVCFFCLFSLTNVLSVVRLFTHSDYPFAVFKLFLTFFTQQKTNL